MTATVRNAALVDLNQTSGNYLFRVGVSGNFTAAAPFDYDGLLQSLSEAANQSNVSLPASYQLHVISLLSFEQAQLEAERNFFSQNQSLGNYTSWPVWGSLINPMSLDVDQRTQLAVTLINVTSDDLPSRISQLRQLMSAMRNIPVLHVLHCYRGKDRTGEVVMSYFLSSAQLSLQEALDLDARQTPNENRTVICWFVWATQWYCYNRLALGAYKFSSCALPSDFTNCSTLKTAVSASGLQLPTLILLATMAALVLLVLAP
jgi:protein-tyrosine phosphatase